MLRAPLRAERGVLVSLGEATGVFAPGEAEGLLGGVLDGWAAGALGEGHRVGVWEEAGRAVGWAYWAPTPHSGRAWDLWWIGVEVARHRSGIGTRLLEAVEREIVSAGGAVLVIETSSKPTFDGTRRFYARRGYRDCGAIPDFYAPGDGKVIYARTLNSAG